MLHRSFPKDYVSLAHKTSGLKTLLPSNCICLWKIQCGGKIVPEASSKLLCKPSSQVLPYIYKQKIYHLNHF